METQSGVSTAYKKDGSRYYRSSVTYNNKHISLGSFSTEEDAHKAYLEARHILNNSDSSIADYSADHALSFSKYVILVNLMKNGIYFKTPIFLLPNYFLYYLSPDSTLKFDKDDLFFYSSHTIQQRGGYLFVCHYGSQYSILSRYGIRQFAVEGRDYIFVNGDTTDYRYDNIKILNEYTGVTSKMISGRMVYTASIHVNGNYIVGRYNSEIDAAIAYNKAADTLIQNGHGKNYVKNYIETLSKEEYASRYQAISISRKILDFRASESD